MALPKASTVKKVVAEKPAKSLEDYVSERITSASEAGFNTVKMWVKNDNEAELQRLLADAGYDAPELLVAEEHSKQWRVAW